MIVDLFAGPGGWDEGLRMLGRRDVIGVEWDKAACQTAIAAGHNRIHADVTDLDPSSFSDVEGVIASPPCQAWSTAGNRKGELDRANCHALADRMSAGDDSTDWAPWEDARSPLVCEPIRWVRNLRPQWVAFEEVPAVASLWEHFAHILRGWGYSVWTGDLLAADYGVPQTRTRRILMAHREIAAHPPMPTHTKAPAGESLFGAGPEPWVSMATALGWSEAVVISPARGAGMTERHGERPAHPADKPAPTVISKSRSWVVDRRTNSKAAGGRMEPTVPVPVTQPAPTVTGKNPPFVVRPNETPPVFVNGNQANAGRRSANEPAPTLLFGHRSNDVRWAYEQPATIVVGSFSPDTIAAPGHRTSVSRQNAPGSVRVSVGEAGILQSFPADYPWQGSRSKQYEQVGNAVPPLLAAHILAALRVGSFKSERAA